MRLSSPGTTEIADVLAAFQRAFDRKPRILHIGNIANNAFNNARFLNAAGFDCDVICYDYYHIMGCPEWEEADLTCIPEAHFRPVWMPCMGSYRRPEWFAQGPLSECIRYLRARREGRTREADRLWRILAKHNGTGVADRTPDRPRRPPRAEPYLISYLRSISQVPDLRGRLLTKLRKKLAWLGGAGEAIVWGAYWLLLPLLLVLRWVFSPPPEKIYPFIRATIERFDAAFPDRKDRLSEEELRPYIACLPEWQALFDHYDIVQAYATDPLLPMLAGKHPYIGFEHGTLRDFTLGDSAICRLTALGYNQADHVLITNGDCLEYAKKIGVKRYSAMIHPIDDVTIRATEGDPEGVRRRYGVRHVFLCTLRHDWAVKGTDKYIRALPALVQEIGADFVMLMTRWGAELEASKQLARDLGVFDRIRWIDPMSKRALVRMQKSVDVQFDQIALPHFGATAPEAMAAGVPVIMSYDPRSTEWIIPETAPILSAWTSEEIVRAVRTALDPAWLADYRSRARDWIDRWHSRARVVELHGRVYAPILAEKLARTTRTERELHE